MTAKRLSKSLSRRAFLRGALTLSAGLLASGCDASQLDPGPTDSGPTAPATAGATPGATLTPTAAGSIYPDIQRVQDLVSRMTLEEKVSQMGTVAPGIERLGIPDYNWWNESLHGVGRAGLATVFPQVIGLASTWNPDLILKMATAIADEGRAKHHEAARRGVRDLYTGLTFFSPNVNIFRDPRWGRGQETYGEDPYLTSRLAVQYIRGLQGDDPVYLKTVATPKHFAVHSGPEAGRHSFNAVVSQRDMAMTYLPAFEACITEAGAFSIMGAYNRVNGEAACASPTLLQRILREQWGFSGYVVADCGAIEDIYSGHQLVYSPVEAAALAVKAGCDLECGCTYGIPCHYGTLQQAVDQGLLSEADIDRALMRLFTARFRLGMFDPEEQVAYAQIPASVVDSPEHRELALEVARQSLVLLKNEANLLPLDRSALRSIAVIGPNADEELVLSGNYFGTAAAPVSVLAGIRALVEPDIQVSHAQGCGLMGTSELGFARAVELASAADVVVMVGGLSQMLEGEEGQQEGNPPGVTSFGDRKGISLPPIQEKLLQTLHATGKPVVLVLLNGSAVAVQWAHENIPAILEAWYPGQAGGMAVAEALFGLTNPGGRLPVTFYHSTKDLPPFEDYSMENRTYRYFSGQPLYPFGYGLSYTRFAYRDLQITPAEVSAGEPVSVQVTVENTGERLGDEVVQLYLQDAEASLPVPLRSLQGFQRVRLQPGEQRTLTFTLSPRQMSFADEAGQWVLEPGQFNLWVGGQQPVSGQDQPANVLAGQFEVV